MANPRGLPIGDPNDVPAPRRHRLGSSPLLAIAVASAGLALGFGLETNPFGFRLWSLPSCTPAKAADLSLQRLIRLRLAQRFQAERRPNASSDENRPTIDDELDRICKHPLYVAIKERMTDHLRYEGYDRVQLAGSRSEKSCSVHGRGARAEHVHPVGASLLSGCE